VAEQLESYVNNSY